MEPIRILHPPATAFNKNRPISDLIKAQVQHFKHVEQNLSPAQRRAIPQHQVTTENEAALYIAAMTATLRGQIVAVAASPKPQVVPIVRRATPLAPKAKPTKGLKLAASAAPAKAAPTAVKKKNAANKKPAKPAKKAAAKKSAAKPAKKTTARKKAVKPLKKSAAKSTKKTASRPSKKAAVKQTKKTAVKPKKKTASKTAKKSVRRKKKGAK